MTIARVALPVAAPSPFDYWVPEGLPVVRGALVKARLARRPLIGVVVDVRGDSDVARERVQPIDEVLAPAVLPDDVLALCEFIADYYQAPIGEAMALAVPPHGTRTRRRTASGDARGEAPADAPRANDAQRAAADAIQAAHGRIETLLLKGVTGSGKTDVYLAAAASAIAAGGQVLLLVPEINLTPQLEARVRAALPHRVTAALHSGLADGVRRAHWLCAAAGEADLVLGTRLGSRLAPALESTRQFPTPHRVE